ncbi:MAG: hypothetical protein NVSMB20_10390 [Bradyrhizobium sp.]
MILRPAPGLVIRDNITFQVLSEKGEERVMTDYWQRLVNDGEVIATGSDAPAPRPVSQT